MKFYEVLRIVDDLGKQRAARWGSITQQVFGYLSDSARMDESIDLGALVVAGAVLSDSVRKSRLQLMLQLTFRLGVTLRNCLLAIAAL